MCAVEYLSDSILLPVAVLLLPLMSGVVGEGVRRQGRRGREGGPRTSTPGHGSTLTVIEYTT